MIMVCLRYCISDRFLLRGAIVGPLRNRLGDVIHAFAGGPQYLDPSADPLGKSVSSESLFTGKQFYFFRSPFFGAPATYNHAALALMQPIWRTRAFCTEFRRLGVLVLMVLVG